MSSRIYNIRGQDGKPKPTSRHSHILQQHKEPQTVQGFFRIYILGFGVKF